MVPSEARRAKPSPEKNLSLGNFCVSPKRIAEDRINVHSLRNDQKTGASARRRSPRHLRIHAPPRDTKKIPLLFPDALTPQTFFRKMPSAHLYRPCHDATVRARSHP